ncbi:MAG TPA: MarR family transcriptional regulator [Casimicrobiaceae bacterium]
MRSPTDSSQWQDCGTISKQTFSGTEAKMKRKIEVTVGDLSGALDRFEQAWHRGAAGKARSAEVRLTFESLPLLLRNLTPARWKLLEAVKRSGPTSINELARLLGRNYKNVHTDVTRLVELGLIERMTDQRIVVAWDTIVAEMKLAA